MFTDRITSDNGQAATATLEPKAPRTRTRSAAAPPSPNGANGDFTSPQREQGNPESSRDANGKFAKGNGGGPGNPFGRKVAALRQAVLDYLTPDVIRSILAKLTELSLAGDVQAAKLLFAYGIGKPVPVSDPDQVDVQEWDLFKAQACMLEEMPALITRPDPELPLSMVRGVKPVVTEEHRKMLGNFLSMPGRDRETMLTHMSLISPTDAAVELAKLGKKTPAQPKQAPSPIGGNGGTSSCSSNRG